MSKQATQTITLEKCITINQALQGLATTKSRFAYAISRNAQVVGKIVADYTAYRETKLKELADKDESGKPILEIVSKSSGKILGIVTPETVINEKENSLQYRLSKENLQLLDEQCKEAIKAEHAVNFFTIDVARTEEIEAEPCFIEPLLDYVFVEPQETETQSS